MALLLAGAITTTSTAFAVFMYYRTLSTVIEIPLHQRELNTAITGFVIAELKPVSVRQLGSIRYQTIDTHSLLVQGLKDKFDTLYHIDNDLADDD